jgi:hypothetical protein
MPFEKIHAVITTADREARNELIVANLQRLAMTLARIQQAAASLRDLLQPPAGEIDQAYGSLATYVTGHEPS